MARVPRCISPVAKQKLGSRGVRFVRKEVKSIEEARHTAKCDVIVHASGPGAFDLAADQDVVAARGQTIFVESDFDELMMLQGSQYTYNIPRIYTGAVIIGGVSQERNREIWIVRHMRNCGLIFVNGSGRCPRGSLARWI